MKYSLSTREILRAEPEGFPEGSGYISQYIILNNGILKLNSSVLPSSEEFLQASPSGTHSGKGVYLTVYPSSRPNTDTVQYIIINNGILKLNSSVLPSSEGYISQYTP